MEITCFLGGFLLLLSSQHVSSDYLPSRHSDENSYVAAVVEFHPEVCSSIENMEASLGANIGQAENFITSAKQKGADIIVFPEYGMTGAYSSRNRALLAQLAQTVPSVPPYGETAVPCLSPNASSALKNISCSARSNQIYVLVNLPEGVPCSQDDKDCPDDGVYIYNTNVVFDRDGAVIAKYHKYNLYLEDAMNKPAEPTYSTFATDFGVTFGTFVCFDILHKEPAFNLAAVMNIKNFVYPTAWISELPFFTAIQVQESWAFGLNVNLLASGYNNPDEGHGGSGIYSGTKGALVSHMPTTIGSKLLISQVPIIPQSSYSILNNQVESGNIFLMPSDTPLSHPIQYPYYMRLNYESLSKYTYSNVLKAGKNDVQLCYHQLCCQFHADLQTATENYRFVIYDGIRILGSPRYQAGVQVCGLLYCKGENFSQCSHVPRDPSILDSVAFNSISISGTFNSSQFIFPSTSDGALIPLSPNLLHFTNINNEVTIALEEVLKGMLTFAIVGRNFDLDHSS